MASQNGALARLGPRALRSPLLHFFIFGALLYSFVHADPYRIELNPLQLESARRAMRDSLGTDQLTATQRLEADQRVIEDELLYRRALAMGLDRDDQVVRQRLVQKMLLMVDDLGLGTRGPDEGTLRTLYVKRSSELTTEASFAFRHIFLREPDERRIERIRQALREDASAVSATGLGDRFPLGRGRIEASVSQLEEIFGKEFVARLAESSAGWSGPIRSRAGIHFVEVVASAPARKVGFEEARPWLTAEWRQAQRQQRHREYLRALVEKYTVRLDSRAPAADRTRLAQALAGMAMR